MQKLKFSPSFAYEIPSKWTRRKMDMQSLQKYQNKKILPWKKYFFSPPFWLIKHNLTCLESRKSRSKSLAKFETKMRLVDCETNQPIGTSNTKHWRVAHCEGVICCCRCHRLYQVKNITIIIVVACQHAPCNKKKGPCYTWRIHAIGN